MSPLDTFWKRFFKSPAIDSILMEKRSLRDQVKERQGLMPYAWFVPGFGWGIRLRLNGQSPDPYLCKFFTSELESWKAAAQEPAQSQRLE